jgi:chromosome segregation ATPase
MNEAATDINKPKQDEADKPKRERKPRAPASLAGDLRALADSHRARIRKLREHEGKLLNQLLPLRAELEQTEALLHSVEESLARVPGLPVRVDNDNAQLPEAAQ